MKPAMCSSCSAAIQVPHAHTPHASPRTTFTCRSHSAAALAGWLLLLALLHAQAAAGQRSPPLRYRTHPPPAKQQSPAPQQQTQSQTQTKQQQSTSRTKSPPLLSRRLREPPASKRGPAAKQPPPAALRPKMTTTQMVAAQHTCNCGHQHFLSSQDAFVRSFLQLKPGLLSALANKTKSVSALSWRCERAEASSSFPRPGQAPR
jgi:hypothetical protein